MITKLAITNFRGIQSATLEGLSPLTIFVGKNGQGKSTILEAAYIVGNAPNVNALVYAIARRGWYGPATWDFLVPAGLAPQTPDRILSFSMKAQILRDGSNAVDVQVEGTTSRSYNADIVERARQEGIKPDIQLTFSLSGDRPGQLTAIADAEGRLSTPTALGPQSKTCLDAAVLLDADSFRRPQRIEQALSSATVGGWLDAALSFGRRVVVGLTDIRLVELHGRPVTMLYYGGGRASIPFHVAGDGVRRIIELALAVLGGPPGLIAIEEPENFLHPGSRKICADVIWAAVQRGEQVLVSTHNLDLMDDLLGLNGSTPRDVEKVAVFRVSLVNGTLQAIRIPGKDAKDSREILGQDLRT